MNPSPIRIQRKRTLGWKMPENTVSVTRPGKWGNPFKIIRGEIWVCVLDRRKTDNTWVCYGSWNPVFHGRDFSNKDVVKLFHDLLINPNCHVVHTEVKERFVWMHERIKDLKGKNLACFCNVGNPCHADVLLKLVNDEGDQG